MLKITDTDLQNFRTHLTALDRSEATISKYLHDARVLIEFAPEGITGKIQLNSFKTWLEAKGLCVSSINSMFGAINQLLAFLGSDLRLKYIKVQRQIYLPTDKELTQAEYERMVRSAEVQGNGRLALRTQTICALGLRVSELKAITVESLAFGEAHFRTRASSARS